MFPLNIRNDEISFFDIKLEHLPLILEWYNKVDDFKFATGLDAPISLAELTRRYAEVAVCGSEFFVGIYSFAEKRMVGILKGSVGLTHKDAVWIGSIVIGTGFQKRGFGSLAVKMLLQHMKNSCRIREAYLAVIESNMQGRAFWMKNGFKELREMGKRIKLHNTFQSVIIMHRVI